MKLASQSQHAVDFAALISPHDQSESEEPITRIRINEAWNPHAVPRRRNKGKISSIAINNITEEPALPNFEAAEEKAKKIAFLLTQQLRQHEDSSSTALATFDKSTQQDILRSKALNVISLEQRLQLERCRIEKEASLPYQFHGVELDQWESDINWDGVSVNKTSSELAQPSINTAKEILSETYNPHLEAIDLDNVISWEGASAPPGVNERLATTNGALLLESDVAGASVIASSAFQQIFPKPFSESDVYKLRMDRKLQGSVKVHSASIGALQKDKALLEKEIEERQLKRAQIEKDKAQRIKGVLGKMDLAGTGRAITSSLMGPGGTERTGRPARENLSSLAYDAEYIEQLDLISNHTLVKADLSLSELRHYFRPLLPRKIFRTDKNDSSWQLQLQVKVFPNASLVDRRGRRSGTDGSLVSSLVNSSLPGTLSQSKIRRGSDLTPTEGDLVLFEYCEERPPLQLTKGMASKIINYYRGDRSKCPISRGGGDRPVRRRKHGIQEDGSKLDGVIEKAEKPPRLSGPESNVKSITDLIGKIPTKKKHEDKHDKDSNLTILPEGVTEILHAKDHGPFIGAVSENSTQSGLISNLFSAPIFRHEPKSTDFLMILGKLPARSADGPDSNTIPVILRPMPKSLFTVGQTEPKQKVHAPDSTNEKAFFGTFASFHIAKALQRKKERESGLTFEDIRESLFPNTDIRDPFLRSKLRGVASFDKNTGIYSLRDVGDGDYEGVDALARKMSPEDVSAHLCARLYLQRLQDLGICDTPLKGNTMVATAIAFLNGCVKTAESRYISMKKLAHSQRKSDRYDTFAAATQRLEEEWKSLKKKAELANYVYEELQLSPWQITTDFIDVHKKGVGSGMMKLTGLGDPSGIGNAYNLLRETDGKTGSRASVAASNKDLEDRVKKITGTDNDLRKLNMTQMASILRSYGMQQKDIDVLRRWDRVHVIRDLSTKAASDNISDGLERFARGEKIRLSDQKKIYQERIQEIWNRQRSSLMETGLEVDISRGTNMTDGIDDRHGEKKSFETVEGRDIGSDDDDEDGFEDEFDDAFKDTEKTNELVSNQLRNETEDTEAFRAHVIQKPKGKFLDREAMALAALQREREEEQAMQMGMNTVSQKELHKASMAANKNRRVIRRKIIKTHPDGTQKVSFEFIIQPNEVKKILMEKSAALDAKKNKKKYDDDKLFFPPSNPVGHSVFEDENESRIVVQKKMVRAHRGRKSIVDDDYSPARRKTSKGKARGKSMGEKKPKRKRSEDEDLELFISTNRRKGTSNRKERGAARERMPHVLLADRLEQIRSSCEMRPNSAAFHRPVDKAFNVYHERIKNPIDLSTIRETIFKYEYKTAQAFLDDFFLMMNNAVSFNGAGSMLGNEATAMYEFVKATIEQNRAEFDALEIAVDEQYSGKSISRTSTATPSLTGNVPAGRTTNVVIDGVTTSVNLGDLKLDPFAHDD